MHAHRSEARDAALRNRTRRQLRPKSHRSEVKRVASPAVASLTLFKAMSSISAQTASCHREGEGLGGKSGARSVQRCDLSVVLNFSPSSATTRRRPASAPPGTWSRRPSTQPYGSAARRMSSRPGERSVRASAAQIGVRRRRGFARDGAFCQGRVGRGKSSGGLPPVYRIARGFGVQTQPCGVWIELRCVDSPDLAIHLTVRMSVPLHLQRVTDPYR